MATGILAIDAALWDAVGGWDPAYIGWGGEDDDMSLRLTRAAGGPPTHPLETLTMLAHPRPEDPHNDPYAIANRARYNALIGGAP